jgi:cysteine-rich repeat protein
MSFFPSKVLTAALTAFALLGCGDDESAEPSDGASSASTSATTSGSGTGAGGEGTGAGGGDPGPCQVLTPLDTSIAFYTSAIFALDARIEVPIEGYAKTRLNLELYPSIDAFPMPGTYDLSAAPDDTYETCLHCVILAAYDETGQPRRAFFQESGSMTITKFDQDLTGVAAGQVDDVRLVEVTQHPDGSWSVVDGGLCFDVPSWSFDTTVVNGGACERVEDCPNEGAQACDVKTNTCQDFQCNLFLDPPVCDDGYKCMSQIGAFIDREEQGPAIGACYPQCVPGEAGSSGDCGDGFTCFALDATQTNGLCLSHGGPAIGEACDLPDVATGCAAGGICTGEPPTCHAICDYLTTDPGCPSGTYCSALNLCEPLAVGDIAIVDQPCALDTPTLTDCGPEGSAFRGVCFRLFESELEATCRRTCRTADPDCPAGTECIPAFTNEHVGICADPGTCGDGTLDLLGAELCDDGNTVSGDGCSADCATAEFAPLCSLAEPLVAGTAVVDTNEGGVTGYASLCDPFVANPSKTYAFTPPAPGELTLRLTSLENLGVSVLGDCLDNGSELGCRMDDGEDLLHVNFASVPAQPALVVVRGFTPLETGLFILESEFTVAVCGDGLVGGPEACDDGNQVGGDGCAADCSAIQWTELCAGLPVIQDGSVINASLDDAFSFFDLNGLCSYESGTDRAYQFTAPAAGTLTVNVASEDDLTVFIRDACGPITPEAYLSCGNSASEGATETAQAGLSGGQVVTVVVDGFTREDAGDFTLTASFQ